MTFVATANAISYCGASPHFVDVDRDTMGMSPSILEEYLDEITELRGGVCYNKYSGKRISACVPMHTFGLPVRIEELKVLCGRYNISLVEDAAESIGASVNGKKTGTFGDFGVFSFNGNKTVTSGGGGVIVTDNLELAKRANTLNATKVTTIRIQP